MDTEERLIAQAAQANRALGASGQSDMVWGHASIRDPYKRGVWMKASGWSFDEVTSDRVALVSPDGEVLGDGVGCLIPQHGLVTVGPDPATAVMRALLLARACHNQLQAMAAGPIRRSSDSAEIALKKRQVWPQSQINAGYAYLCRQAG